MELFVKEQCQSDKYKEIYASGCGYMCANTRMVNARVHHECGITRRVTIKPQAFASLTDGLYETHLEWHTMVYVVC